MMQPRSPDGRTRIWLLSIPIIVSVIVVVITIVVNGRRHENAKGHDNGTFSVSAVPAPHRIVSSFNAAKPAAATDNSAISALETAANNEIIIGTAKGNVEFWNENGVPSGSVSPAAHLDNLPIIAVAVSGDGTTWAAATLNTVYVGTRAHPSEFARIQPASTRELSGLETVGSIGLSFHGETLAVGIFGVELYDIHFRQLVARFDQPSAIANSTKSRTEYSSVGISADGLTVFASDVSGTELWSQNDRSLRVSLDCRCSWSSRGNWVSGSSNGNVSLFNPATGVPMRSFTPSTRKDQYVVSTAVSDDGENVFVLLGDGELQAWNIPTGKVTARINSFNAHIVNGYLELSSGDRFVVAGIQTDASKFIDGAQKYEYALMIEDVKFG